MATTRLEVFREGVQECEARICLEQALTDEQLAARLGPDLVLGRELQRLVVHEDQQDALEVPDPLGDVHLRAEQVDAHARRGEPGLPKGFTWRGDDIVIGELLESWKHSSREGGAAGDLYLRRHYYRLRMEDATVWTVYFVRQTPRSGNPKQRWYLYTVEPE